MKLAFFTGSLQIGGAERVISHLANFFSPKNNVHIITWSNLPSEYKLNVNVNHIKLLQHSNGNFLSKNFKRYMSLREHILANNYDAFIVFLPIPSFILLSFRRCIKSPIIVSVRSNPHEEYKKFWARVFMKSLYPKADGFVFQTDEAKQYFSTCIQEKSIIIPNMLSPQFVKAPYTGIRKKEIVSVGRLDKYKNYPMLIQAFAEISESFPDYRLVIYGSGSMKQQLLDLVKKLNLEHRVIFKGKSYHIENDIYESALFVLPSNVEGFPNALLEAMSLGLPCIATDCPGGGTKALIQSGFNGILVPTEDIASLAKHMNYLLTNKILSAQIGDNAYKISQKFYDEKIDVHWDKYINQLVKEKQNV